VTSTDTKVRGKWRGEEAARRYAGFRWKSDGARGRDARILRGLLAEVARRVSVQSALDAPCGTGRLRETLRAASPHCVGLDASLDMLREGANPLSVLGDTACLPFAARSFDLVLCCRLLHHLDQTSLERTLFELCRVAREFVIVSFWDASTWHAWRRRTGLRRTAREPQRSAIRKDTLAAAFERAGAEVLLYRHSLRFVSQQAFALARVRDRELPCV
jgi:SAM-dependent methyltransferase